MYTHIHIHIHLHLYIYNNILSIFYAQGPAVGAGKTMTIKTDMIPGLLKLAVQYLERS